MASVSHHVGVQCKNSERERLLLVIMLVYSVKTVKVYYCLLILFPRLKLAMKNKTITSSS